MTMFFCTHFVAKALLVLVIAGILNRQQGVCTCATEGLEPVVDESAHSTHLVSNLKWRWLLMAG